jgi:hypothetical protein
MGQTPHPPELVVWLSRLWLMVIASNWNSLALILLCHKPLMLHHALAARAPLESLRQCAGDRRTYRGNRVGDVPLRSDWGILGVGNCGIEQAF